MKCSNITIFVFMSVLLFSSSWAASTTDAVVAYNKKDYATVVSIFTDHAKQGDAFAQTFLGWMYDNGEGVLDDDAAATQWWKLAAEQGHAKAQVFLGVRYVNGNGIGKDPVEAVKWYRRAAEQGYAKGQSNLGGMYAAGTGVTKDEAEAAKWYLLAAGQGDLKAQTALGVMFEKGLGVSQDYVRSYLWWSLAAAQGSDVAVKGKDALAKLMTPAQLEEAARLLAVWRPIR